MKSKPSTTTKQQVLTRVATNLYRSNKTGIYYTIFKRGGKQVKCSLETTNRELAQRRLDNQRAKKGRLFAGNSKKLPFAEYEHNRALIGGLAKDWLDVESATIEPSTRDRHLDNIKQLRRFFGGTPIGRISRKQVEEWARRRAIKSSPRTYNLELPEPNMPVISFLPNSKRLTNTGRRASERTIVHEITSVTSPNRPRCILNRGPNPRRHRATGVLRKRLSPFWPFSDTVSICKPSSDRVTDFQDARIFSQMK